MFDFDAAAGDAVQPAASAAAKYCPETCGLASIRSCCCRLAASRFET